MVVSKYARDNPAKPHGFSKLTPVPRAADWDGVSEELVADCEGTNPAADDQFRRW
jgi:hypothetical protein